MKHTGSIVCGCIRDASALLSEKPIQIIIRFIVPTTIGVSNNVGHSHEEVRNDINSTTTAAGGTANITSFICAIAVTTVLIPNSFVAKQTIVSILT